ncbi:MAG: phosphoglycerate dehydrogenase [Thermoplasmata archaeon]|mgnify:CR=1 FL=1|nr:MAG: phosphoglycerate dehydrogenase [Thermoplasmata archaeon]
MKVLVTDPVAEEALNLLREKHEVVFEELRGEELAKEIGKYDALMVRSATKVTKDIIEKAENLKVIGRAGIGVDNIDVEAASQRGIYVVNSPTGSTRSVAELTFALMFAVARKIHIADATMRQGIWAKKKLKGIELMNKTLGLIGSGNIAQEVAKMANCLGMKVLVYSPHCTEEKARKMGAELRSLEEIFREADFVSLHIPKTEETYHMIDERLLSLMKPTAYLINAARGGVVDEEALYKVLKEGKIAGAAIDVYEKEPPEKSPLFELENVVFTPHIGAATKEGQIRAGTICAEQILKVLDGKEPDFWVNRHMMKS